LTRTGAGVGTPEYMSPEQCKGGKLDIRTDIYSLGIMLYEMMCGRPPFQAAEYTAIAHAHVYELVPLPTRYNDRLSPAVQSVILKALEKRPENRFQSAREMADALSAAIQARPKRTSSRPMQVQCEECGKYNPVGMNFCQHCGANLRGGPPAPLPPSLGEHLSLVPCPHCGVDNPTFPGKYCKRCGRRLNPIKCTNCGYSNPPTEKQCMDCGHELSR
jgi:serine/threonine protein kinase